MTSYLLSLLLISVPPKDSSEVFRKYFGEMESVSKQIVNPNTPEASRRALVQRLTTEIEISKELAALADLVKSDVYLSTLSHKTGTTREAVDLTWKKLSLRVLKTMSGNELNALMARLRHSDNAVQSMALISLTERLRKSSAATTNENPIQMATSALQLDELANIFNSIYERSRSVEPAFLAATRTKSADREIAAEVSQHLRQTLANQ